MNALENWKLSRPRNGYANNDVISLSPRERGEQDASRRAVTNRFTEILDTRELVARRAKRERERGGRQRLHSHLGGFARNHGRKFRPYVKVQKLRSSHSGRRWSESW